MRHRKAGRKLNMRAPHRKATFRNMVTSLVLHGRIRTTEARAKEIQRFTERVISIAKRAPSVAAIEALSGEEARSAAAKRVHAIRRARIWLNDKVALDRLFAEVAPSFEERPGGYTRVVKADIRSGDNAPMAVIEILGTPAPVAAVSVEPEADDAEPVAAAE